MAPVWRAMASATLGLTEAPGKIASTSSRRIVGSGRRHRARMVGPGWSGMGSPRLPPVGRSGRSSRTRRGRSRACAGRRGRGAGTRRISRSRARCPSQVGGGVARVGCRGGGVGVGQRIADRGDRRLRVASSSPGLRRRRTAPECAAENYGPRIATGPDACTRKDAILFTSHSRQGEGRQVARPALEVPYRNATRQRVQADARCVLGVGRSQPTPWG